MADNITYYDTMSTPKYPRSVRQALLRDLETYPVVALMGARQVGKSTLGRELAEARGMAYRTLDDRDVLRQAREDPEGLLDDLNGAGFIDEAQRAPEIFLALKAIVDREQRAGQYLLSGSNQPVMSGAVGDSLLGRAAYRTLRPLTLSELRLDETHAGWDFLFEQSTSRVIDELERRADASGSLDWRATVEMGGFPRAVAAPADMRRRMLDDYVEVFANRDIRELLAIESADRFEQFMRLVASRTGQVLNVNGLSGELGIPVTTVRRWLDALKRSFLVELIPAFSRNAGHRVTKAPKLFMTDVALALAAAREPEPTGFHLETLVASDLAVWRDGSLNCAVHHWRTQSGQEVDFIAERDRKLLPIELKASTGVGLADARHLKVFLGGYDAVVRSLLLSADPVIRELTPKIIAAPWWAVL
ncbi:MAG: ATP-binding protein [Gemmatimonadaceae bacterium]